MAHPNLFATLNVARRQLRERGLEPEAVFLTRRVMAFSTESEAIAYISTYIDMVLAPLPTAPDKTEGT